MIKVPLVIKEEKKQRMNKVFEWILRIIGYTLIFILVTNRFESVYIDMKHSYIYSVLVILILSILNNTIKPVLVTFTIPITGLTLGIFYPLINLFILKLVDWILGPYFQLKNIWIALLVSILLSIMNFLMDSLIISPIIKGVKKHGQSSH